MQVNIGLESSKTTEPKASPLDGLRPASESVCFSMSRSIADCRQQITSRFDGVIKKLHYEPEAMAQVGKANPDIASTLSNSS